MIVRSMLICLPVYIVVLIVLKTTAYLLLTFTYKYGQEFHCMSVQYDKHIFIITNTMLTIGVDKITLFKTT